MRPNDEAIESDATPANPKQIESSQLHAIAPGPGTLRTLGRILVLGGLLACVIPFIACFRN